MKLQKFNFGNLQYNWLVVLRVAIGWHFLFEGYVKVINPHWTSGGYLNDSKGILSGMFYSLAANVELLKIADFLNQWGLVILGLCLILGAFTKLASIGGMLLLALYYFSHPPFLGFEYALPSEGSYLVVDKTLIEFCALGVIAVTGTGAYLGLDRLWIKKKVSID